MGPNTHSGAGRHRLSCRTVLVTEGLYMLEVWEGLLMTVCSPLAVRLPRVSLIREKR